jgi:ABC-2 type transport system ATP-binding protein
MGDHLAIEATGLTKAYGTTQVLGGVDLRVAPGSVFSLLGPNGAGKPVTELRHLFSSVRMTNRNRPGRGTGELG